VIAYTQNIPSELDKISHDYNIETWFDAELQYDETIMVFTVKAFDAKTKEVLWVKVYTSDSIYRDKMPLTEGQELAENTMVGSLTFGYAYLPNIEKRSHMLGFGLRLGEQFNDGNDALGGKFGFLVEPSLLVSNYPNYSGDPSQDPNVKEKDKNRVNPYRYAATTQIFYFHNFSSNSKNLEATANFLLHIDAGGIICPGYLTFYGNVGPMLKIGKSIIFEASLAYVAPATISVTSSYVLSTPGGLGFDVSFGFLF
jgi:hypothetical protein